MTARAKARAAATAVARSRKSRDRTHPSMYLKALYGFSMFSIGGGLPSFQRKGKRVVVVDLGGFMVESLRWGLGLRV